MLSMQLWHQVKFNFSVEGICALDIFPEIWRSSIYRPQLDCYWQSIVRVSHWVCEYVCVRVCVHTLRPSRCVCVRVTQVQVLTSPIPWVCMCLDVSGCVCVCVCVLGTSVCVPVSVARSTSCSAAWQLDHSLRPPPTPPMCCNLYKSPSCSFRTSTLPRWQL